MLTADHAVDASNPRRSGWFGRRGLVAGIVVLAVALAGGAWWAWHRVNQPILGKGCTAIASGRTVTLDAEQAGNAAIITAVAVQRQLPARAATIAIATALQESKLRNLTFGDRDSLGLFQQRPSQGWGTKAQVTDPVYASNAFYDVLVKIEGYRNLSVTKAAQKVQRSAFPSAYADHEADARVLASAMSGNSAAAFTCVFAPLHGATESAGASGLTPRGDSVAKAAQRELGASVTATGAHGRSLELTLGSGSGVPKVDAWAIAQWALARGGSLPVVAISTSDRGWSRTDRPNRWDHSGDRQLAPGHVVVQVA
jgi:hypothetical protein